MIYPLSGDDLGVAKDDKHVLFEWHEHGRVVFSATQHGEAMSCHFAAEKKALKYVKIAIEEFINFVFQKCEWCKMIIAIVKVKSVERLLPKCNFQLVAELNEHSIFERVRNV
jgi:hypothetical protein